MPLCTYYRWVGYTLHRYHFLANFFACLLLLHLLLLLLLMFSLHQLLAYAISFATGSSFGTMGILFPLIGPLAWTLGGGSLPVLLHCFGAVYGGSLFGNMFSPIADTSILTVMFSRNKLEESPLTFYALPSSRASSSKHLAPAV